MPLGAGLLRLVGTECNIHTPADFLKLGNIGAGLFQFGIIAVPLCFEVSIFLFPFRNTAAEALRFGHNAHIQDFLGCARLLLRRAGHLRHAVHIENPP